MALGLPAVWPVSVWVLCLLCVQGVLAANIFDWGAKACVDMYHNATILEMYREVGAVLPGTGAGW